MNWQVGLVCLIAKRPFLAIRIVPDFVSGAELIVWDGSVGVAVECSLLGRVTRVAIGRQPE